jgi:HTH-type transcriptional regulator/antitoxin HigA
MDIRSIKTQGDYKRALRAIEQLWHAKPDTPESERLELLSILAEAFEREQYPTSPPDPIAAIKHCMDSRGLAPKDLEPYNGSRGAGLRGDRKAPASYLEHDPPPHRRTGHAR